MPPKFTAATGSGTNYANPMIHGPKGVISVPVAVSTIPVTDIDADGVLKPGVVLQDKGATFGPMAAAGFAYGVVFEPVKVAKSNSVADIAAAANVDVAVSTAGEVNRAVAEANLGRVYNANELASFPLAGSRIRLVD